MKEKTPKNSILSRRQALKSIGTLGTLAFSGSAISGSATAQPFVDRRQKLTASDAAADDIFGYSVAIHGNTALVGVPSDDNAEERDRGAVYVYEFRGGEWQETQKLSVSDAAAGDRFGYSVAIHGSTALVGAPNVNNAEGSSVGAAYVYQYRGEWRETQKLTASDGATDDFFGYSVAIHGNTALIGAPGVDNAEGPAVGAAYTYQFRGEWRETQRLTASDAVFGDSFGLSVAIHGKTVLVGAPGVDAGGPSTGAAYIYRFRGEWRETQKLTVSDAALGDSFGKTVAIHGNTVLVGAPNVDNPEARDTGAAYIFR